MSTPVTIRVGPATSRIEAGVLSTDCINDLSEQCSFEIAGAEHMKRSGRFGSRYGQQWDGKKRLYHKGHRTFGTGLLERVSTVLRHHGFEPALDIESIGHSPVAYRKPGEEWALRDYQRRSVLTALESGRGMVKVATGGGKTVIAGHLIHLLGQRTVFLVHTKDLLYQAKTTFSSMFGDERVGQVGDGLIDPRDITVCTLQTAARALEVEFVKDSFAEGDEDNWKDKDTNHADQRIKRMMQDCGLVMMDECHRVAATTASNVVTAIDAAYRFGFSASPWRDDGADLVLEAVFGEIIVDIDASTLIDAGHLVAPIIRVRNVPPARFGKKDPYSTVYEQYIVENEQRNRIVTAGAIGMLARGVQTMILVRHIKHGHLIKNMLEEGSPADNLPFLTGKDDSTTRNSVIQDMRDQKLNLLIATTLADEGLDIKPLAGVVLAGGGKSSTRALQRVGRVLRPFPGKKVAEVLEFEDNAKFLYDHYRARMKMYESERRFTIVDY